MRLHNEFTVAVPVERVWETLLDIERVAGFLPGATIEPGGEDGVYHGAMKVKVGPMTVNYQGTARMAGVDESAHTADIEVKAKEAKGQGTAAATIRNTLVPEGDGTRVVAETDLQVTGRQAQFGRGMMQDIAGRMLGQFAQRFEQYLLEQDGAAPEAAPGEEPSAAAAPQTPPATDDVPDALDLGSVLSSTPYVRYGAAAAGAVLAVGTAVVLGRRRSGRRGITVKLDFNA